MGDLVVLSTFQATDVMFAGQKDTILLGDFAYLALVRFLLLSFSVGTCLLALVGHVAAKLELSTILKQESLTFFRFRGKSEPGSENKQITTH